MSSIAIDRILGAATADSEPVPFDLKQTNPLVRCLLEARESGLGFWDSLERVNTLRFALRSLDVPSTRSQS